jgi:ABC-type Fe3+-hydroxamate transport system substrate-binding protein
VLFTDQMQRQVLLQNTPQRIISLVPSQTELLFSLGLGDKVVGVTKFCIHPKEEVQHITKVGGTKSFHFDLIEQLAPDLIIGNKEENYQEGIEQLAQQYPVWMSDIYTLPDALQMITSLGLVVGAEKAANSLAQAISSQFQGLSPTASPIKTAYFIWRNPLIAVGSTNFIDHMLSLCGFENAFKAIPRYPQISPEQLVAADPELILLSSEPYPFKEKHFAEFQALCPKAKIMVVDGELFSWYGSKLVHSAVYLQKIITEASSFRKE